MNTNFKVRSCSDYFNIINVLYTQDLKNNKTISVWKNFQEAKEAAKQDAQQKQPVKVLDKINYSFGNIELYKVYTKEYLQQLQDQTNQSSVVSKVRKATVISLPGNVTQKCFKQAENNLKELEQLETKFLASLCGNKAANLIELTKICDSLRMQGISVYVPNFLPLFHEQIKEHINTYYPGYEDDWKNFSEIQFGKKELLPEGRKILQHVQEKIITAFTQHPFISSEVKDFLETQKGMELMVRSTGLEDTAKSANAGGNLSEAGVLPDINSLSRSIGKVVASYHSPLSLTQRLLAEEDITAVPFVPVLLQTMIGEGSNEYSNDQNIFVSGVSYTKETLGETEFLTQIEATYGHNEAVVMGALPVDTYYIYPNGLHHDIIRPKEFRLVADLKVGFITKKNPSSLSHKAALKPEQLQKLQKISEAIHQHFGTTQDIEWVYDPAIDTFFIVQARPLVKRFEQDPMSVDMSNLRNLAAEVASLPGTSVVNKGNRVSVLLAEDNVVSDINLERAFNRFWRIARTVEGREKIKAVVVKEMPANTSHHACTLREMGVDVFCADDFDAKLLSQYNTCALIDHLEGQLLVVTDDGQGPRQLNQFLEAGIVKRGWSKHPIAARESVKEPEYLEKELSVEEEERIIKELCGNIFANFEFKDFPCSAAEVRALIKNISSEDKEQAKLAVQQFTYWIAQCVQKLTTTPDLYREALQILRNVVVIANHLIDQKTTRLQQLHLAKRLEALMYQERTVDIINAHSLVQIFSEKQAIEKVALADLDFTNAELSSLREIEAEQLASIESPEAQIQWKTPLSDWEIKLALAIYHVADSMMLTPEAKEIWTKLTQKVASSKSRMANRQLLDLFHMTQALGVFGEWANIYLKDAYREIGDNCFAILHVMNREIKKVLVNFKIIKDAKDRLKPWNQRLNDWQDPEKFKKLYSQFQKTIFKDLLKNYKLFSSKKITSKLVEKALSNYLLQAVDLFDCAIKSLRSSQQYEDQKELQASRFQTMLHDYLALTKIAINAIPDETIFTWTRGFTLASGEEKFSKDPLYFRKVIIEKMDQVWQNIAAKPINEVQLRPSDRFSVLSTVINSGAFQCIEQTETKTLEDLFTLMHQNILAAITGTAANPWNGHLPKGLHDLVSAFEKLKTQYKFVYGDINVIPNLLEINYAHPKFIMKINIPLKLHSASLNVVYNVVKETALIDFHLLGHNMNNRMYSIGRNLFFESVSDGFKMSIPPLYDAVHQELSIAWLLTKKQLSCSSECYKLQRILSKTLENSFKGVYGVVESPNYGSLNRENLSKLWKAPQVLRQWLSLGCPNVRNLVNYLIENNQEKKAIQLFGKMGIKIAHSNESFENRLKTAVIEAFSQPNGLRKWDAHNELLVWLKEFEWRTHYKMIQNELANLLLASKSEKISKILSDMQLSILAGAIQQKWNLKEEKLMSDFPDHKWKILSDFVSDEEKWESFKEELIPRHDQLGMKYFADLISNDIKSVKALIEDNFENISSDFFKENWNLIEEFLRLEFPGWDEEEKEFWSPDYLDNYQLQNLSGYFKIRWSNMETTLEQEYKKGKAAQIAVKVLHKPKMAKTLKLLAENQQFAPLQNILSGNLLIYTESGILDVNLPQKERQHIKSLIKANR